jgi:hypothetical protein
MKPYTAFGLHEDLRKSRNNESYMFHLYFAHFLGQFLPLSFAHSFNNDSQTGIKGMC